MRRIVAGVLAKRLSVLGVQIVLSLLRRVVTELQGYWKSVA